MARLIFTKSCRDEAARQGLSLPGEDPEQPKSHMQKLKAIDKKVKALKRKYDKRSKRWSLR